MPGGSHGPSDGAEPAPYRPCVWGTDSCTGESASCKDSAEAGLAKAQQVFWEQKHQGAMPAHVCASWIPQLPGHSWVSSVYCIISEMVLEVLL